MLGKLAATLAPPEPQLQHAALRLTARGWETAPLAAPEGSGAVVVALDLRSHEALAEHSDGRERRVPLTPDRAVGAVTRELLEAVGELGGPVEIDPTPQEVSWTVALDEDTEHATYDPRQVRTYSPRRARQRSCLPRFRAPYRGRSTPVGVVRPGGQPVFSGAPADPPAEDFIMRNAMDAEEVALGWWPGDERYGRPAFYAYAHLVPASFEDARLEPPAARWDAALGEFVLDADDARAGGDLHAAALAFARSAFQRACAVCEWDPARPASATGTLPQVA